MSVFIQIAKKYNWNLKGDPARLNGGFMHKMYKIDTEHRTYALKMLNPFVMQRKTAMENYALAEQLELLLEQKDVSILPALSFDGRKMQEIDGNYFYIFDYFYGKALKSNEVTKYHCTEMGKALAKIHSIDRKYMNQSVSDMSIDWDYYLSELNKVDIRLYTILENALPIIQKSQNNGNQARKKLPQIVSICHNDMDCKNVLWSGNDYRIIDLECLSYNNPFMELFELALCWSGYEHCQIDFQLFQSFCRGIKMQAEKCP